MDPVDEGAAGAQRILLGGIRHRPQSPGLSTAGDGGGRVGGGARGCVEFVRVMHLDDLGAVVVAGGDLREAHRERSEEHTSELQSRGHLVCRLLLEKKKKLIIT